jgi:hypothetical protein
MIHMSSVICCPLQSFHPLDTDLSAVTTNYAVLKGDDGNFPIWSTATEHATPEDADMWIKDGISLEMTIKCIEVDPTKATFLDGDKQKALALQAPKPGAPGAKPGGSPSTGGGAGPSPPGAAPSSPGPAPGPAPKP